MTETLQAFLLWVEAHPHSAQWLLFAVAFFEAVFVIGAFVPAAPILFAYGALIALGTLDLWPTVLVSTVGTLAGGVLGFWVARAQGERLFEHPRMRRHADTLERGRRFFQRHGGKSILLTRFLGPLRTVTPVIAGAAGMQPWLFVLADGAASLLWSLAYLMPGVVFGASLALAAEVGARLAALLGLLLAILVVSAWLARRSVVFLQAHAEHWTANLLDWSHRHRRLGRMGEALADPQQPETPGLAIAAALLLALGAGWLTLYWGLGWREYPPTLDAFVYQGLQDLRTPWATAAAVAIAQLGEWEVYLPVALAVQFALLGRRRRAAAHWAAALAFAGVIALALFALPTFSNPLEFYHGQLRAHFSGRELILSTVVYGFLPVLLGAHRSAGERATIYGAATSLLLLILLAELYLGAQWFSFALFAMGLGLLWIVTLGFGYRRHGAEPIALARVLPLALTVFAAAAVLHWTQGFDARADAARPRWKLNSMSAADWWNGGWRTLPAQRVDMAGREKTSFNLQWAGDLKDIEAAMEPRGWRWPVRPSAGNMLRWLAASAGIAELPVLPQVHAGRHQALMLRHAVDEQHQTLIQLWPSEWRIAGGERIWVGQIVVQEARTRYRLFSYPVSDAGIEPPARTLLSDVPGFRFKQVARPESSAPLWLLRPRSSEAPDEAVSDD